MSLTADMRRKNLRKQMYFDSIVGVISGIISVFSIIFVTINQGIFSVNLVAFTISISFWIAFLCFALFMLFLGFYTWYLDKHWDESKQRKNLKPPKIG